MPIKRRAAKARIGAVPELEWSILTDQTDPFAVQGWEGFFTRYYHHPGSLSVPTLGDYWLSHGDEFTADWIAEHPGTRPSFWWKFTAPRWMDFDPLMAEPRRRVGGTGTPDRATRSDAQRLDLLRYHQGVPVSWSGLDPADPPIFESQAAYLDRHGLFLPGERRRLRKDALAPERIEVAGSVCV